MGKLDGELNASAFCTVFDLIANIAVLRENRDTDSFDEQNYRPPVAIWEDRIRVRKPRGLGAGYTTGHRVWVLDLNKNWISLNAGMLEDLRLHDGDLDQYDTEIDLDRFPGGSPILDEDGFAIGMICAPEKLEGKMIVGAHPILAWHLPGLSLREIVPEG